MKLHQIKKRLGCRRSLPDHRDWLIASPSRAEKAALPAAFTTRDHQPPVYDQGQLGSCTANAVARVLQWLEMNKTGQARPVPSRLFQYYNSRALEGHTHSDSGATLRDAVRAVATYGYVKEQLYPYLVKRYAQQPPKALYGAAAKHELTAVEYRAVVQTQADIMNVLASANLMVFGIGVYSSFESVGSDGLVPMPTASDSMLGGHALCAVGYDQRGVVFPNSWGTSWGDQGYGLLPWAYITNPSLAFDFWTVSDVPAPDANS